MGGFGLILCAGYKTAIGIFYLTALQKIAPLIYVAMANAGRWFLLLTFSMSVVVPYTMQKFQNTVNSTRLYVLFSWILVLGAVLPFISGQLTRKIPAQSGSTQPLNLKITTQNNDDYEVYKFLAKDKEPYRVFYVPAPSLSWPGETNISFEWSSLFSPKPAFPTSHGTKIGKEILENIYSEIPSHKLSKILGFASVKYVIIPKYDHHYSYIDYRPELDLSRFDGLKDYKSIFDKNFFSQKRFELALDLPTIKVFENLDFVPLIYDSSNSSSINKNLLTSDVAIDNYIESVLFSSEQRHQKVINFYKINPATYYLEINSSTKQLIFNETYDENWMLYKINSNNECLAIWKLSIPFLNNYFIKTCLINIEGNQIFHGFANSWHINNQDKDGHDSRKYIIYHIEQVNYLMGISLSILTFFSIFIFVIYIKFISSKNA